MEGHRHPSGNFYYDHLGYRRYHFNDQQRQSLIQRKRDFGMLANYRRKDQLQKKVLFKIAYRVYRKFKFRPRVTKTQALAMMEVYYGLDIPGKQIFFNRLWGYGKKLGLYNDVVRELLTNDRLIEDFLSQEALEQVLEAMHEQLVEDIKKCAERFNQDPEGFLANQTPTDQVAEVGNGEMNRNQRVKRVWTYQDNIQAVIAFLKKLHFRAGIEQLPEMTIMLQNRIDHFSQKLPLN